MAVESGSAPPKIRSAHTYKLRLLLIFLKHLQNNGEMVHRKSDRSSPFSQNTRGLWMPCALFRGERCKSVRFSTLNLLLALQLIYGGLFDRTSPFFTAINVDQCTLNNFCPSSSNLLRLTPPITDTHTEMVFFSLSVFVFTYHLMS